MVSRGWYLNYFVIIDIKRFKLVTQDGLSRRIFIRIYTEIFFCRLTSEEYLRMKDMILLMAVDGNYRCVIHS